MRVVVFFAAVLRAAGFLSDEEAEAFFFPAMLPLEELIFRAGFRFAEVLAAPRLLLAAAAFLRGARVEAARDRFRGVAFLSSSPESDDTAALTIRETPAATTAPTIVLPILPIIVCPFPGWRCRRPVVAG